LRVERLTRQHGIRARMRRQFRGRTTNSRHDLPIVARRDLRGNTAGLAGRSVPTSEGWLYLAAVRDLFTRKIVGWAMRDHRRAERAIAASPWP
jgi:putative transposase